MDSLQNIWKRRFSEHQMETQKYLKYVFTGHLMIVIVFALGAGGLAYSEWLKVIPEQFPVALIATTLLALTFIFRNPATLFRDADAVYFLPLEHRLTTYTQASIRWTTGTKFILPIVTAIVLLPLINTKYAFAPLEIFIFFAILFAWHVLVTRGEWYYRHSHRGRNMYVLYIIHYVLSWVLIYALLMNWYVVAAAVLVVYGYGSQGVWKKRALTEPFPFDHFIELEKNRMMRFYRFANLFTDVPHIQGKVHRRAYASFLMTASKPFEKEKSFQYLLSRTFVRTDELFRLYLRLFVLMAFGVAFIESQLLMIVFVGSLQFALVSQLLAYLSQTKHFKMDRLFPIEQKGRRDAVEKIVFQLGTIQIFIIVIIAFFVRDKMVEGLLLFVLLQAISAMTMFSTRPKS